MRHFSVARLFKSMTMACIALTSAPLMAVDFDQSQYDVYIGDRNGDGRDDILLVAKDSIIPIHGEVLVPLAVQLSENYAIESGPGFYYDPVTLSDAEIDLSGFALATNTVIYDYNNDGQLDLVIGQQGTSLGNIALLGGADSSEDPILVANVDEYDVLSTPPNPGSIGLAESFVIGGALTDSDQLTNIAADFRVSEGGAASYSVPIFTPPGSAGVAPQIELSYSSQNGNGLLGLGWSLSGLSSISRCRQSMAVDGHAAPITWSNNDRFCINGQRLLLESGSHYGAVGATYKTEVDSFSTVTAVGGKSGHPEYFIMESKDGSTTEFGNQADSLFGNTRGEILSWSINKFSDSVGNKIDFSYTTTAHSQRISRIDYGSESTNHSAVVFQYEPRVDDVIIGHTAGFRTEILNRLNGIQISTNSTVLRQYSLTYDHINTDYSRIVKIDECSDSEKTNCRKATDFEWQYPITGLSSTSEELYSLESTSFIDFKPLDVNGDGNLDLAYIRSSGGGSNHYFAYAISDGITLNMFPTEEKYVEDVGRHTVKLEVIDYNADGRSDVLVYNELDSRWTLFLSEFENGTWTLNKKSFIELPFNAEETSFGDVNSDGLADAFYYEDNNVYVHELVKSGEDISSNQFYRFKETPRVIPIRVRGGPTYFEVADVCGELKYNTSGTEIDLESGAIGDYNADGRIDLVFSVKQFYSLSPDRFPYGDYPNRGGDPLVGPLKASSPNNSLADNNVLPSGARSCPERAFSLTNYIAYTFPADSEEPASLGRLLGAHVFDDRDDEARLIAIDINSDGNTDIATLSKINDQYYRWAVRISDGVSYYPQITLLADTDDNIDESAQFVDFNNDGYTDFIYHDIENSELKVKYWIASSQKFSDSAESIPGYSSDLTGIEYEYSNNSSITYLNSAPSSLDELSVGDDTDDSFFFLNIDGKGGNDLIHFDNSDQTLKIYKNKHVGSTNHAIVGIIDGFGAKTTLHYESSYTSNHYVGLNIGSHTAAENETVCVDVEEAGNRIDNCFNRTKISLSSDDFYSALNEPFSGLSNVQKVAFDMAPVLENQSPNFIVTHVSSSSPIPSNLGAMSTVSYFYEKSKLQAAGRGFLGYQKLSTLDHQTGIETTTTYRQDYPYLGRPLKTETRFDNRLLSSSINIWNTKKASRLDGVKYQPFIERIEDITYRISSSFNDGLNIRSEITKKVVTENTYDDYGNATEIHITTTGDGNTYTIQTTNDYGVSIESQELGRLRSSEVRHSRTGLLGTEIVRKSNYAYYGFGCNGPENMRGLLCSEETKSGENSNLKTTYEYDSYGNQIKTTSYATGEQSRSSSSTYSNFGRYMDEVANHYGQKTQDVISWDNYGQPTEVKDLLGNSSIYKYTAFGDSYLQYSDTGSFSVTYRTNPEDCPVGAVYRINTYAPDNAESYECIDKVGRTVKTAEKLLDGGWSFTLSEYDILSRLVRQSEPYKSQEVIYWTNYYYDILGNITRTDQPDYAGSTRDSYMSYDGLSKTDTNVLGQQRTETNNALGELVQLVDNIGTSVSYQYNAIGDLRFTKTSSGSVTHTIEMKFDNYSNKTQTIDPDKGTWKYEYNGFKELILQENSNGNVRAIEYDSLGRQIRRVEPDGTSQWVYNNTVSGNSRGQMDYEVLFDSSGNIPYQMNYLYDSFGRISEIKTYIDGEEFTERTTYDAYGRNFQSFDAAIVQNGVQYRYKNGYMYKVVDTTDVDKIYYQANQMDARGNVTQYVQESVSINRAYDASTGFLTTVGSTVAGVFGTQDLSYSWDALGNLKSRTEQSGNKNLFEEFNYDALNRLSSSKIGNKTLNYNYDAFGNITYKTDIGDYKYSSACAEGAGPHAVCEITNDSTTETFEYDNNGNMLVHRVNGAVDRQFVYSSFDKPTRITKGDHTTEFEYGVDRNRYKRIDSNNGETTTTLYVGSIEILNKPGGSREIRRYINGTVLVTQDYNLDGNSDYQFARAVTRNILTDHLGSTDVITDVNGQIVQEQSFDAWGARRAAIDGVRLDAISLVSLSDVNNEFTTKGFTGHEMVDQVGIVHMNGRIFDSRLGRFVQADPNIDGVDTTQGYNRYSYVHNNPLNAIDPTGFFLDKLVGAAVNGLVGEIIANVVPEFRPILQTGTCTFGGAIGCALSSFGNTFAAGGSFRDSLKAGALTYASIQAFAFIGDTFVGDPGTRFAKGGFNHGLAHAFTGGVISELQGGKFGHGFVSAGVSFGSGHYAENSGYSVGYQFLFAVISGGVTSELTGGKFSNGAITSTQQFIFNQLAHSAQKESWGFKNNADGDLILCIGASACSASSNIQDASTSQIVLEGIGMIPWGKATKFLPGSRAAAEALKTQLTSKMIASGHAFEKHVLHQGQFPFIRTRAQFASHIESVMTNPTHFKQLGGGRAAYFDQRTSTIVFTNPGDADGGTAFQTTLKYFNDQN